MVRISNQLQGAAFSSRSKLKSPAGVPFPCVFLFAVAFLSRPGSNHAAALLAGRVWDMVPCHVFFLLFFFQWLFINIIMTIIIILVSSFCACICTLSTSRGSLLTADTLLLHLAHSETRKPGSKLCTSTPCPDITLALELGSLA